MKANQLNSSLLVGFFITKADDAEELPVVLGASGECPIQIVDSLPKEISVHHNSDDEWDVVQ